MRMPSAYEIAKALKWLYDQQNKDEQRRLYGLIKDCKRKDSEIRITRVELIMHLLEPQIDKETKLAKQPPTAEEFDVLRYNHICSWVSMWDLIDWDSLIDLANHMSAEEEFEPIIIPAAHEDHQDITQAFYSNDADEKARAWCDVFNNALEPAKRNGEEAKKFKTSHRTYLGRVSIPLGGEPTTFKRHFGHESIYVASIAKNTKVVVTLKFGRGLKPKHLKQGDLLLLSSWHEHQVAYVMDDPEAEPASLDPALLLVSWPMLAKWYSDKLPVSN